MNNIKSEEERKQDEIDFHNNRDIDQRNMEREAFLKKYPNKGFYSTVEKSTNYWRNTIRSECKGKKVLDYCCGAGGNSRFLASCGATVTGIDLSDSEIETATNLAAQEGLSQNTEFIVMDAEKMSFSDETFNMIICSGVLHHVDLDVAYKELNRVLKPGGKLVCIEALGHNPIIRQYRKMTPNLRTPWEVDHILKTKDINKGKMYFHSLNIKYFHLASILAIPFRRRFFFKPLLSFLNIVDEIILRIPGIRLMAWQCIFIYTK